MRKMGCLRVFPLGVILTLTILFSPKTLFAQESVDILVRLKKQATESEQSGKWEAALQTWVQIYSLDRQHLEAREHIQTCLRQVLQTRRQVDTSIQKKILTLTRLQATTLYGEVLQKVHSFYVDSERSTPTKLFQAGVRELISALDNPEFRKKYLANAAEANIRGFQNILRDAWLTQEVESIDQAKIFVGRICNAVQQELKLRATNAVILEFIGGACNSLDEFSAYISPGDLVADEPLSAESVVQTELFKGAVGYFRITHFSDTTPAELDKAVASLRMAAGGDVNLRALIMDLRGNPGGQLLSAVQVAERFLPEGVIVTTQGQVKEFNKVFTSGAGANALSIPLIVLVDGETASAAEVLASAFRDHQRATIIGTTTYGKGSVQRVITLTSAQEIGPNGQLTPRTGAIRITLARVTAPNGQAINGSGVIPHVVQADKTRQLDSAIEHAARFMSMMMTVPPR